MTPRYNDQLATLHDRLEAAESAARTLVQRKRDSEIIEALSDGTASGDQFDRLFEIIEQPLRTSVLNGAAALRLTGSRVVKQNPPAAGDFFYAAVASLAFRHEHRPDLFPLIPALVMLELGWYLPRPETVPDFREKAQLALIHRLVAADGLEDLEFQIQRTIELGHTSVVQAESEEEVARLLALVKPIERQNYALPILMFVSPTGQKVESRLLSDGSQMVPAYYMRVDPGN